MQGHSVEQIDYWGDETTGAYREALVIREADREHFILRRVYIDPSTRRMVYRMARFGTKTELSAIGIGFSLPEESWKETDERCGFDGIPTQYFLDAHNNRLENRL